MVRPYTRKDYIRKIPASKIVQYDTHKKEKKKRKSVIFCEFLLY